MSVLKKTVLAVVVAVVFLPTTVFAQNVKQAYVEINTVQVREKVSTLGRMFGFSKDAEVYMDIYLDSHEEKDDALIAVESELAGGYGFYIRTNTGKAIKDEDEITFIPIEQRQEKYLNYMGMHVRLTDIDEMPEFGEKFPLTLVFREAGRVNVEATVILSSSKRH